MEKGIQYRCSHKLSSIVSYKGGGHFGSEQAKLCLTPCRLCRSEEIDLSLFFILFFYISLGNIRLTLSSKYFFLLCILCVCKINGKFTPTPCSLDLVCPLLFLLKETPQANSTFLFVVFPYSVQSLSKFFSLL